VFPQFYWNDADREPRLAAQLAAAAAAVSDALDAQAAAVISALWGAATRDRPPGLLGPTRSGCAFLDRSPAFPSRRGVVAAIWWPHGEDDRSGAHLRRSRARRWRRSDGARGVAGVDRCWGGCAERGDPPAQAAIDWVMPRTPTGSYRLTRQPRPVLWIVRGRELAPECSRSCSGQAGGSALLPGPAWHRGIGRRGGGA